MGFAANLSDIPHVIQLAVAPVFLLAGVGMMLSVFTSRLARIVDQWRLLEERTQPLGPPRPHSISAELHSLSSRALIVDIAIALTTFTGLLVCIVIGALFMSLTGRQLTGLVSILFVLAMLAFALAFMLFLFEVLIATVHLARSPAFRQRATPTLQPTGSGHCASWLRKE